MENENYKKKNDLMKSIMSNPKMSRQFRDALSSPIGSTKRDQAKSVLSIMKKVSGLRNDGMGGPTDLFSSNQSSQTTSPSGSYYIFPAVPKLKSTTSSNTANPMTELKNMFAGNPVIQDIGSSFSTMASTLKGTTPVNNNYNTPNMSVAPAAPKVNQTNMSVAPSSQANMTLSSTGQPGTSSQVVPNQTNSDSIKKLQSELNAKNAGQPGWVPLVVDGIMGAKTTAAQSFVPVKTNNNTGNNGGGNTGNNGGATRTFDSTTTNTTNQGVPQINYKNEASKAVAEGTGPGLFAMNTANEKFGGSLEQYINTLDEKLKNDFNLEPLELELSNLKSSSENFIPTLTSYMKGKDEYSSAIDKMIKNAEGQLLTTNMADPYTANQYQNYMTYLYTLKGRQNERYGNYLNAAISDYNADVTKLQSNYDNVYQRYTDALTRQGTLAQNEYNTLYTTMADLYTNLENAPIKAQNARILQQQIDSNNLALLQNGVDSGSIYPDFYKDVETFSKNITDKDGILLPDQIGAAGLAGLFNEAVNLSGDPKRALAVAKALNVAMSKGLSASTDKITDLSKYKKLVSELSQVQGGQELADMITPTLNQASYPLVSDYVLKNLSTIKNAATQLVEGKSSWLGKGTQPGLKDPTSWTKNFSSIDSGVLEDLYNHAQINYNGNTSDYISTLFSGSGDKNIASNLTSSIMSTW